MVGFFALLGVLGKLLPRKFGFFLLAPEIFIFFAVMGIVALGMSFGGILVWSQQLNFSAADSPLVLGALTVAASLVDALLVGAGLIGALSNFV